MSGEWRKLRIGDFLTLQYGKALPKSERQSDGKYPVYGANGVKDYSNYYYAQGKTLIIGRKGSVGEITVTEEKFWPLDVTYYAEFDEKEYDINFLYHLLKQQNLESLAKGVKPGINRNLVYDIEVEIPPLEEQKQIVSLLDQAFQAIDQAKANVEKNIQNAEELFQKSLNDLVKSGTESWREKRLGEVCDLENGFAFKSKDYVQESNTVSIRMSNIRPDGEFNPEHNIKYLPDQYAEDFSQFLLNEGDLIIAMTDMAGDPRILGIPTVVKDLKGRNFLLNQRVGKLKPFSENVDSQFLRYYLSSKEMREFYKSRGKKGIQINLSKKDILNAPILIPSLGEQTRIVRILNELNSKKNNLVGLYNKKILRLEELKNSLLQKAFQGELTQEDAKVTADAYE